MGKKNKVGKWFKKVGRAILGATKSDPAPQKATHLEAQRLKREMVNKFNRGRIAQSEYNRFLGKRS